jgi:hypothetical protein
MGNGRKNGDVTENQTYKVTAGQCELPVMVDGKENDDGTENKIYKVNGQFRTPFG